MSNEYEDEVDVDVEEDDDNEDDDDDQFTYAEGAEGAEEDGEGGDVGEEPAKIEEEEEIGDEEDDDLTEFQKILVQKEEKKFRTHNRLTKYERAALIGYRAQQIAEGATPYVEVGKLSDPASIAEKEYEEGKFIFNPKRPLPSNKIGKFTYEIRPMNELIDVNFKI